ncbi:MAG: PepSY domain-containing protein [Acidobacteria bacterium]|nr:PepSY domain-containing protein [Acidobacteriota bacterium]
MNIPFRKTLFWLHLIAGCMAGIIILVMSFTGVLLTYERQILAWSDRGQVRTDPAPNTPRKTVAEIVEALKRHGEAPVENMTLTLRSDPREPVEARAGRNEVLFVDSYTGKVSQASASSARGFFQKMTAWHRCLGMEGSGRTTAKAITGACNLAFLVLILSGAYLWLPRTWSVQTVRPIFWFRTGMSGKARDFNWHNVFGVWALVPLFFVVVTALPMSYGWANDLLYRMTGSEAPPPPAAKKGAPGRNGPNRRPQGAIPENLNQLWANAANQVPGWTSISASLGVPAGAPVSFSIDTGDGGQPQKRSTLVLDTSTGSVMRTETFAGATPGRRLRMWTRFVHTGEYYGVVGQTMAGIGSAAGVMLVWTGISLALRRLAAWYSRRKRHAVAVEEPVGAGARLEP